MSEPQTTTSQHARAISRTDLEREQWREGYLDRLDRKPREDWKPAACHEGWDDGEKACKP